MDTTEQKLAQALQREVHLRMSIDAERRCSDSLRAALKKCKDEIADMPFNHAEKIGNLTTELTIAKQELTENNNGSLRSELEYQSALKKESGEYIDLLRGENISLHTELTLTSQNTANALLELRGARAVIEHYGNEDNWITPGIDQDPELCNWYSVQDEHGYDRAKQWLTLHAQQTEAPLLTRVPIEETTIRNLTPYPLDLDWEFQVTEREIKLTGVIVKTEEAKSKEPDPEAEAEQAKESMWEKEQ